MESFFTTKRAYFKMKKLLKSFTVATLSLTVAILAASAAWPNVSYAQSSENGEEETDSDDSEDESIFEVLQELALQTLCTMWGGKPRTVTARDGSTHTIVIESPPIPGMCGVDRRAQDSYSGPN